MIISLRGIKTYSPFSVCNSLNASPMAVAAGLCVDNIFALIYFPTTSALASGRPDVSTIGAINEFRESINHGYDSQTISVQNVSTTLAVSAILLWLAEKIGGTSGALPVCTLLTVIFASQAPKSLLGPLQSPANMLGTLSLYLFFATAGAPGVAVAESVRTSILPLTLFLSCLYSMHGILLFFLAVIGKVLPKMSFLAPQRLVVASSAAIGGPATAVALAQASGWSNLEVPSLLVGNVGYAIATFAGLAFHRFFS